MKRMRLEGLDPALYPQDLTLLPGMKTIMGDQSDKYRVTYVNDIEYADRGGYKLHIQMLVPGSWMPLESQVRKDRYPLVVYVQGSAFRQQNCYMSLPMLVDTARLGYVVASVEYRPSDIAGFPAYLQDVKTAIRFLRANADQYLIDSDRIAIWGDSSGGNAALMAGVTGDMEEFRTDDYAGYSDKVDLVVDFYGATDLAQLDLSPRNPNFATNENEDLLLGGVVRDHPELAVPACPMTYISKEKEIPPILVLHGDCDTVIPFQQSVLLYKKLIECEKSVEFYKVVGGEHGLAFWTKEVLDIVGKFLGAFF